MESERWDLIVVGAGPAGCSAALAALQRAPASRVLLLDRDDFPRDKSCGDAVAPHTVDVLDSLGAAGVLTGRTPVFDLALTSEDGVSVQRRMRRPLHVVPRVLFDARLVEAAQAAGAVRRRHRVRSLAVREDGVVVDGEMHGAVVVGADGAESTVRRAIGQPVNGEGDVAIAIRGYARSPATVARVVASGTDWPAYAWAFPTGDGMVNVGYGEVLRGSPRTRTGLLERLDELLPGASDEAVGWRAHRLPLSTARPHQPDGRVMLTGDAASLVNPMSGEGIFYAVLSGATAGAAATLGADAGAAYRRNMRRRLSRHLRATSGGVRLARRPALVRAGLRVARRDQRVFDWYVELGLGDGVVHATQAAAAAGRLLTGVSR